jgi:hypothetical protein
MNTLQHVGAFVVQLRIESALRGEHLVGRIEHVASGRTANFHSREELLAFLDRMVEEIRSDATRGRPSSL